MLRKIGVNLYFANDFVSKCIKLKNTKANILMIYLQNFPQNETLCFSLIYVNELFLFFNLNFVYSVHITARS